MNRGYGKAYIFKSVGKLIRKHRHHNVFGAEVIGVNKIDAKLLCVKEAVVFNIGRNICIAAGSDCIP